MSPAVSAISEADDGTWSIGVSPGHADELLAALDPSVPFVVVECGDPGRGWHDAPVSIGPEREPQLRRVKALAFDLLTDPAEARQLGPLLRREHDGRLRAVQLHRQPGPYFRFPADPRARAHAMRGLGVHLTIDFPHDEEVAVVRSVSPEAVDGFARRLLGGITT